MFEVMLVRAESTTGSSTENRTYRGYFYKENFASLTCRCDDTVWTNRGQPGREGASKAENCDYEKWVVNNTSEFFSGLPARFGYYWIELKADNEDSNDSQPNASVNLVHMLRIWIE